MKKSTWLPALKAAFLIFLCFFFLLCMVASVYDLSVLLCAALSLPLALLAAC